LTVPVNSTSTETVGVKPEGSELIDTRKSWRPAVIHEIRNVQVATMMRQNGKHVIASGSSQKIHHG